MPFEVIQPRRLYQQVADQLRQLIDAGEYGVGDRLPAERDLSERLGVSRPTVREALIALEVEGRVRIRVGSGVTVTRPPERPFHPVPAGVEGPFEVLRARELVESAVAFEAARLAGPGDLERLDAALGSMRSGRHPSPETIVSDRSFHVGVAEILGNAVMVRFVGELFDQRMTPYFERLSTYFENRESWRLAHEEHVAVRDAIQARDPEAAAAAMRLHLQTSQERFQCSFGEVCATGEGGGGPPALRRTAG